MPLSLSLSNPLHTNIHRILHAIVDRRIEGSKNTRTKDRSTGQDPADWKMRRDLRDVELLDNDVDDDGAGDKTAEDDAKKGAGDHGAVEQRGPKQHRREHERRRDLRSMPGDGSGLVARAKPNIVHQSASGSVLRSARRGRLDGTQGEGRSACGRVCSGVLGRIFSWAPYVDISCEALQLPDRSFGHTKNKETPTNKTPNQTRVKSAHQQLAAKASAMAECLAPLS